MRHGSLFSLVLDYPDSISYNLAVDHAKEQITNLAHLMEEFGLEEAKLDFDDGKIFFSRRGPVVAGSAVVAAPVGESTPAEPRRQKAKPAAPAAATGTPIPSPMMGIFYGSPTPNDPPFVKEGDVIAPGQVIGLIEAMKVFNEVTAPIGGRVTKVAAKNSQLVQQGETLILVG